MPANVRAVLGVGMILTACGGGVNGMANESPEAILAAAADAMRSAGAVRFVEQATSRGVSGETTTRTAEVTFTPRGVAGNVKDVGLTFVGTPGRVYVKGRAFFEDRGFPPHLVERIGDRWVAAAATGTGLDKFARLNTPAHWADCVRASYPPGTLRKGPEGTVDGREAITLIETGDKPGRAPARLYIAARGTPRLVREEQTGPVNPGGDLRQPAACGGDLIDPAELQVRREYTYDEKVDVAAPKDFIDLSRPG